MRKHVFTLMTLFMVTLTASAQKLVGGDLSLVLPMNRLVTNG